jgi:DNA primase
MIPTRGQAIDFIEKCFGKAVLTNSGLNASVVCPKCAEKEDNLQKRKLVVRTDDFLTHCWVCGYRSTNLVNLLSDYHPYLVEEYKDRFGIKQTYKRCGIDLNKLFSGSENPEILVPKLQLPQGFTLMATNLGKGLKPVENAWSYLKTRNVSESELWLWKFGVTDYQPPRGEQSYRFRVIVPSFDAQGNLNYFSARSYWKRLSGAKYANPNVPREHLIFNELMIDWSEELTIVEGVFDLIKCGENATCLLGSTLDANYLLFQRIVERNTPVLLALDNDAKNKTYKLAKLFLEYGISVRIFSVPEQYNDVGQMTKAEFQEQAKKAVPFTNADCLRWKLKDL